MSHRRFSPTELSMIEGYRLLSNLVVPRPIALVSTVGVNGVANLAPFSFFMLGGTNPPSVCFSPTLGRAGEKDTLRNIRDTGEFTVNLVGENMATGMNEASAPMGPDESEWERTGFEARPSVIVKPAWVSLAPAALECKLFQVVEHGTGQASARYIIGEVVMVHVHEGLLTGEGVDHRQVKLLARLGGDDYLVASQAEPFALVRPQQ